MLLEGTSSYDNVASKTTTGGTPYLGSYATYQSGNAGTGFNSIYYGDALPYFKKIHLDGMNQAFCDGHVKWMSAAKLNTLGTATIPFAGKKNGAGAYYQNNGIANFQPLTETAAGP